MGETKKRYIAFSCFRHSIATGSHVLHWPTGARSVLAHVGQYRAPVVGPHHDGQNCRQFDYHWIHPKGDLMVASRENSNGAPPWHRIEHAVLDREQMHERVRQYQELKRAILARVTLLPRRSLCPLRVNWLEKNIQKKSIIWDC